MKSPRYRRSHSILGGLALALALVTAAPSAHANVFASNVKINGGMTNVAVAQGTGVSISYILNEAASSGVTIKILSGATVVRTMTIASGAGTTRGLNTVAWDGKNNAGASLPAGDYSVSITAAATGYAGWTKITDDDNPGNYSYYSLGIAVDRNTNSPYYGRVFVGNSSPGPRSSNGDLVGIQKLNADGSYADEGGFSDGGIAWRDGESAPWKIRVSDDHYVYVEDWYDYGDIYRFDGAISSASRLHVFAAPTDGSLGNWSGFCLAGQGTNTVLWAADANPSGLAIEKFSAQPDGTFAVTNGTQVVAVAGSPGLNVDQAPYAVALDKAGAIYTVQHSIHQGDGSALVFRFPAYDPSTNGGAPVTNADWVKGPGDDYCGAQGIAVDPTGTYVAAAFLGYGGPPFTDGNIKIFNATDGTVVTNLDLGVSYPSTLTTYFHVDPTNHMDTDADWDAAGNLYYLDDWPGCWRAFSPPGANQATTVALAKVQVVPIQITHTGVSAGTVTINFTGLPGDLPSAFTLLSGSVVSGITNVTAATITGSAGVYQATVPTNGPRQFYRIRR